MMIIRRISSRVLPKMNVENLSKFKLKILTCFVLDVLEYGGVIDCYTRINWGLLLINGFSSDLGSIAN